MRRLLLILACLLGSAASAQEDTFVADLAKMAPEISCNTALIVWNGHEDASDSLRWTIYGAVIGAAAARTTDKVPFDAAFAITTALFLSGCLVEPRTPMIEILRAPD